MNRKSKWPVREPLPDLPQKTFKVVPSKAHATLYEIIYHEGGSVPTKLRSSYNKRSAAEKAITDHLATRTLKRNYALIKKREDNAKIKDKARV